jgi:hypothetical protein
MLALHHLSTILPEFGALDCTPTTRLRSRQTSRPHSFTLNRALFHARFLQRQAHPNAATPRHNCSSTAWRRCCRIRAVFAPYSRRIRSAASQHQPHHVPRSADTEMAGTHTKKSLLLGRGMLALCDWCCRSTGLHAHQYNSSSNTIATCLTPERSSSHHRSNLKIALLRATLLRATLTLPQGRCPPIATLLVPAPSRRSRRTSRWQQPFEPPRVNPATRVPSDQVKFCWMEAMEAQKVVYCERGTKSLVLGHRPSAARVGQRRIM